MKSIVAFLTLSAAFAQCPPPPAVEVPPEAAMFSPQQERDLGEIVTELMGRSLRPLPGAELTSQLQKIAARLKPHMPDTGADFRFYLIDASFANAFSLPGGRIYLTRKMVAFARNDDELAGLIAHEMAHIAARHAAAEMGAAFRKILKVNSLGDRQDIFDKFNRLMEESRKRGIAKSDKEHDQRAADAIALHAMSRAGYDLEAFPALFDRLAETKGETGNIFTDMFGSTRPESKRLRDMMRAMPRIVASCVAPRVADAEAFKKWQEFVANFTAGQAGDEQLAGVVRRVSLNPQLRDDLRRTRFSPDGRYVLAQDGDGVTILTHEPFKPVHRIPAYEAGPADFTRDSAAIYFTNAGLGVELWDVATGALRERRETRTQKGCSSTALGADGALIACLDGEQRVRVLNTQTGEVLFDTSLNEGLFAFLLRRVPKPMGFSQDGRYFLITSPGGLFGRGPVLADLKTKKEVSLKEAAKLFLMSHFTFIDANRVLAVNLIDPAKSAIVSIPDGRVLANVGLTRSPLELTADGKRAIARPVKEYTSALFDIDKQKFVLGNRSNAMDVHGEEMVAEETFGELGLYRIGKDIKARIQLPIPRLARVRRAGASNDLRRVAISAQSRSMGWDLEAGKLVFNLLQFDDAYLPESPNIYLETPRRGDKESHRILILDMNSTKGRVGPEMPEGVSGMAGPYVHAFTPGNGKTFNSSWTGLREAAFEVREAATMRVLWTNFFKEEAPEVWWSNDWKTLVFGWPANAKAVGLETSDNKPIRDRLKAAKGSAWFLQVLDPSRGKVKHNVVVTDVGTINHVSAVEDRLLISADSNRILVVDTDGNLQGRVFGSFLSTRGSLFAIQNEPGQVRIYDTARAAHKRDYRFGVPVVMGHFSADGKRFLAVTAAHEAITLDTSDLLSHN